MKRFLSLALFVLLVLSSAACTQLVEPVNSPIPAQTEKQNTPAPSQASPPDPTSSPTPTPEPKPFAPMDIFGSMFNPYGDMELPDNLTIFAATFDKGSEKMKGQSLFVLSMTGSGNMYACIAYWLDVAGLGLDDGKKMERIQEYRSNGYFLEFTGTDEQVITIRQASPEDGRYEYVEADGSHDFTGGGCVIDITFFINAADVEKYTDLVRDNYNLNALAPIADYLDVVPDFRECGISVNLHKNEVNAYAVYYIPNVDAVQKSIEKNVQSDWWEWNGMMETVIRYGPIGSKLTCDGKGGAITIGQAYANLSTAMGEFAEAEVSLTKFGFGFDDAGTCGVYEQHEPHYMNVAIHRPEWGEFAEDWNIEYLDQLNGYGLRITYHLSEDKYHITLDKGNEGAAFDYFPATKEYTGQYPDMDTVHRMFNDAFGTQGEGFYGKPLAYFEQLVRERFGMSIEELYALPIW